MSDWESADGWENAQGWESEKVPLPPAIAGTTPAQMATSKEEPYNWKELWTATPEIAVNLGSSAVAGLYGPLVGLAAQLRGEDGDKAAGRSMEANTYAPRGRLAQEGVAAIGKLMNEVGVPLSGIVHTAPPVSKRPSLPKVEEAAVKLPEVVKKVDGWEDAPVKSMDEAVQQELPFNDSVETAAIEQNKLGTQRDMFTEMDQAQRQADPYAITQDKIAQERTALSQMGDNTRQTADVMKAEAEAKAQMLQEQLPVPPEKAIQEGQMWEQRRAEQIRQMDEEVQANKNDVLSALEEKLRVPRKQRGAIEVGSDLDAVKARFQKFSVEAEPVMFGSNNSVMVRLKTPDGKLAGFVDFAVREDGTLVAENAQVAEGLRGKGAAQRMYLAAREAGYDIAPGRVQTDLGNKMVASLQKRGLINKEAEGPRFSAGNLNLKPLEGEQLPGYPRAMKSPGGRNTGAVNFGSIVDSISKLFPKQTPKSLKEIIANNRIPKDRLPADTIAEALKEGKDTSAYNFTRKTASGSTLEAMTRNSALVRDVSRTVQNAIKRADLYTRETVIPVENAFRRLSMKAVEDLAKVFKWEADNHKLMTAEQLEASGMTEKQMAAYADMRKLNQDTLTVQNEARERLGLTPISNKEYHVASNWRGDYRQPVYDKQGKLVWYLAATSKMGLSKQAKALMKTHPDLVIDPKKGHVAKSGGAKNDVQMMYSTMLDVLGRDNPAVQAMKEAYEAAVATETSSALGQTKHAEHKADIRGFVGDRPGFSAKTEAFEMFQEQIQHAKNAYKWSALQEAGGKLKEVFSNEELAVQQPKNMEYAKDYYQNALGHGTAKWVAAAENAFRELGVSPAVVDKAIGAGKSVFITQKLAASAGYTAAGLLQTLIIIPHLIDQLVKGGGNPLTALPLGMLSGITMGTGHYLNKLGGSFDKVLKGMDSVQSIRFLDEAFKYAEDNGVTSRSIYDENPINQRGVVSKAMEVAGKTMTVPETYVRSAAYMSFVHMLKDSKKFKTNAEVFQRAEELTNASMVDYRASERPMGFANMGVAGNALNTLQTFPINLYNQYRYFTKEAARGNVAPLIAMLSLQYAMAGAMGLPGFNDMDKLFGWAKEKLPDSAWAKVKDFDPKIWMIENLGESSVYGALSTESGVSMTNRLSAPGLGDMAVSPLAPGADLLKQAGNVASAVGDPMDPTKRAQAVHSITPTGLQGAVETKLFPEQFSVDRPDGSKLWKKASDLSSRQGQYVRTPKEEQLRTMGLRSQREVLSNELGYKTRDMDRQVKDRSKSLVDKYYSAVRNGNMKRADEINTLYTKLNGSEITREHVETQMMDEYTSTLEKSSIAAKKIEALKGMARVNKIMKDRDANTRATQ